MHLSREESLGKNFTTDMNRMSNPNDLCYIQCKKVEFGEICAQEPGYVGGPHGAVNCGPRFRTFCSNYCYPTGGGYGGGSDGNSGSGGDNDDEDNDDEKDDCACSFQHQCDLAKEYSNGQYTCSDFTDNYPNYSVYGTGNKFGKHGDYTYIEPELSNLHRKIIDHIYSETGIYDQLRITSGYRCPEGNKDVYENRDKPERDSRHKYGRALDIKTNNSSIWTNKLKVNIKEENKRLYPNTDSYVDSWVHISIN